MSFLSALKGILHVGEAAAPTVATAINPAAGAIVSLAVNAVTQAELKGGTGTEKKAAVMNEVLPAAEGIVNAVLLSKGVKVNSTQLSGSVSNIVDGVVALLNSVGAKASTSAAAAGGASATPAATPAAGASGS